MSKAKSMEEARLPHVKLAQAKGATEKKMPGIEDTLVEGLRAPKAPGEHRMGGVHKGGEHEESTHIGHAGMSHARRHLEKDTERNEHAPVVAGEKMHEHHGRCSHKM